jgi:antitoxin VapB
MHATPCLSLGAAPGVSRRTLRVTGGDDWLRVVMCSLLYIRVANMPLNIRNPEAEKLAAALAKLTGETKTQAVTQALRERLERARRARSKRRLADELDEIALHCASLPVRDKRHPDEILGYDANGLPG